MFLFEKKTPCSNFHFKLSHSYTYFLVSFSLYLTLFMFPLLVCTLLMFTLVVCAFLLCSFLFFLVEQVVFKNTVSFFLFPRPSCFIQSLLSFSFFISLCETLQFFFSFLFRLFSFCSFSLVLSENAHFSQQKTFSFNISKTVSLKFFLVLLPQFQQVLTAFALLTTRSLGLMSSRGSTHTWKIIKGSKKEILKNIFYEKKKTQKIPARRKKEQEKHVFKKEKRKEKKNCFSFFLTKVRKRRKTFFLLEFQRG